MITIHSEPTEYCTLYEPLVVVVSASPAVNGTKHYVLKYQLIEIGQSLEEIPASAERIITFADGSQTSINFKKPISRALELFIPPSDFLTVFYSHWIATGMLKGFKVKFTMLEKDSNDCEEDWVVFEESETSVFYVTNSELLHSSTSRISDIVVMADLPATVHLPQNGWDLLYLSGEGQYGLDTFTLKSYYSDNTTYDYEQSGNNNVIAFRIHNNLAYESKKAYKVEVYHGTDLLKTYMFDLKSCYSDSDAIVYQSTHGGLSVLWMTEESDNVESSSKTYCIKSLNSSTWRNTENAYHYIKHMELIEYKYPSMVTKVYDLLNTRWIGMVIDGVLQQGLIYRHDFTGVKNDEFSFFLSFKLLKDYNRPAV